MSQPAKAAPPAPTQQQQKPPALTGHRLRQRKRAVVHKFEPEAFRDQFLELIPADPADIEQYSDVIEANEVKLDIKRYADTFFELFFTGGLIAPGGVIATDGRPNPFSVFSAESAADVKARVNILTKLARRLKYIPRTLEETLSHLLQYIHKFGDNSDKLAASVGILIANGTIPLTVLSHTIKDHLVNEGHTKKFLTIALQTYVKEQSMDHLTAAMRKAGMEVKMPEFFPVTKRSDKDITQHFEEAGLKPISEFLAKQQSQQLKEAARDELREKIGNETPAEIKTAAKHLMTTNKWTEQETVTILWDSIMSSVDWSSRGDQIETLAVKTVGTWAPILATFCTSPKTEIALLVRVQQYMHDDSRLMKHFRVVVQNLYKHDVVSEAAVLYWYEKGAAPQGKTVFIKQMEPFVNWLREADEESDEDEDDE
ncbi:hypothetical protein HK105_206055 [Polyrhizophydium stewartii]|uniref:W2 domain-containing protein n=1 Tax=Polyrhizophydium stewartii TaxID=2732419 RepID=A0ABR4N4S9_9FUNG